MAHTPPASINTAAPHNKPSFFRNVSAKVSHYHSRVPYIQKLPFPAIAIIITLIIVNLLTWAAVGVVLVRPFNTQDTGYQLTILP
jgi:high-affinity nickel-transport protein